MPTKTSTQSSKPNGPLALVIGGAGFIGSFLCESLLAQNVSVIAIDDLKAGSKVNLEKCEKNKNFTFYDLNINKGIKLSETGFQYIFHIDGIDEFLTELDMSIDNLLLNSVGMYNTLEFARAQNAKVLLVSALDIYNGMLSSLELKNYFGISERDNKRYAHHEAKRYAEALVAEYYRKYNLDSRVVRISDVYGPRMNLDSGTECSQLFNEAINNDTLTVHGDGLKLIRPTYISDIIVGISKAMFSAESTGKIYNLVGKEEINVLNFAYSIQKNSTKPLKIQFTQEFQEINFPAHKVQLAQSEKDLNWHATVPLSEGITLTLEHFYLKLQDTRATVKSTLQKAASATSEVDKGPKNIPAPQPAVIKPKIETVTEIRKDTNSKPKPVSENTKKLFTALNLTLVAVSFFIVLIMFVFPVSALYITTDWSVNASKTVIDNYGKDDLAMNLAAINAQKYSSISNSQFDSLEWFFNLAKKREEFETSRSKLQALDTLNKSLLSIPALQVQSQKFIADLLQGEGQPSTLSNLTQGYENSLLNIQKSTLETSSTEHTLFTSATKAKIKAINSESSAFVSKLQKEYSNNLNLFELLAPQQPKKLVILLMNNAKITPKGGVISGYMYNNISKVGINKFEFKELQNDTNQNFDQSLQEIARTVKADGGQDVDMFVYANNNLLKDLLKSFGGVSLKKYAAVVNDQNLDEKVNTTNNDYVVNIWKGIFKSIQDNYTTKYSVLGNILTDNIKAENIKALVIDHSAKLVLPGCGQQDNVQRFLPDFKAIDNTNIYCVKLSEDQQSDQFQTELKKSAKLEKQVKDDKAEFKYTYTITNSSKEDLSEQLTLNIPAASKLINVQVIFPISFDKVKTVKLDDTNSHTIGVIVEAGATKDVIFEWESTMPELNNEPIYLQKSAGSIFSNLKILNQDDQAITSTNQSILSKSSK